ncbi:MAG: hypothetical protein HBSAPP03_19400 [Phycisphaerae bacterium]|nr:MAG: hypothetical protein HBSAPP03_19400 [Phycisphaerae bacterium]
MHKFVIGFALAFVIRFITGLMVDGGWLREPSMTALQRAPFTFVLPIALATITMLIIHRRTPRRLLDPRVKRPFSQLALGLAAGVGAAMLTVAVGHVFTLLVVKALLIGLLAVGVTSIAIGVLPRCRSYACVHCGSVIPEHESACPGCGAAESRGLDVNSVAA